MINEEEKNEVVTEVTAEENINDEKVEGNNSSEAINNDEIVDEDPEFINVVEVKSKEDVEAKVNEARVAFKTIHSSEMKKNRIVAGIFMLIMVGAFIVGFIIPNYVNFILLGVIVFFVAILLMTKFSRGKMDIAVGDYLGVYGSLSDSYVYSQKEFEDVKLGFRVKPDEEVVKSMRFKLNVFHVGSRDTIKGKMSGVKFETSDVSIKTGDAKDKKTHKTVFVGKMVNIDAACNDSGRVLMYRKGCGDSEPDDLKDVNKVDIKDLSKDWIIYSSNNNYERIFNKATTDALNQLTTDEVLNDVIISVLKDKVLIGLSYTDDLMIIPMENDFQIGGIEHYKNDMGKVALLAKAIEKNNYFSK